MTNRGGSRSSATVSIRSPNGTPVAGTISKPYPGRLDAKGKQVDGIVLRREHYERMLDEMEDLRARHAFEATRDEESFPVEVVDRLIAGESPIRVFRRHRGMTLQTLADSVGRSKSYLSEIETGKKQGSVEVLMRIAASLDVGVEDLV